MSETMGVSNPHVLMIWEDRVNRAGMGKERGQKVVQTSPERTTRDDSQPAVLVSLEVSFGSYFHSYIL